MGKRRSFVVCIGHEWSNEDGMMRIVVPILSPFISLSFHFSSILGTDCSSFASASWDRRIRVKSQSLRIKDTYLAFSMSDIERRGNRNTTNNL